MLYDPKITLLCIYRNELKSYVYTHTHTHTIHIHKHTHTSSHIDFLAALLIITKHESN